MIKERLIIAREIATVRPIVRCTECGHMHELRPPYPELKNGARVAICPLCGQWFDVEKHRASN